MFLLESVGVEIAFQRFKIIVLELKAYILGPPHRKQMRPAIQKDNEVKYGSFCLFFFVILSGIDYFNFSSISEKLQRYRWLQFYKIFTLSWSEHQFQVKSLFAWIRNWAFFLNDLQIGLRRSCSQRTYIISCIHIYDGFDGVSQLENPILDDEKVNI